MKGELPKPAIRSQALFLCRRMSSIFNAADIEQETFSVNITWIYIFSLSLSFFSVLVTKLIVLTVDFVAKWGLPVDDLMNKIKQNKCIFVSFLTANLQHCSLHSF